MKILKYIISLAAAAGMLSACSDVDELRVCDIADAVPAVLHSLPAEITIKADEMDKEVEFLWDSADFGAPAEIRYSIVGAYEGVELPLFTGITGTSYTATYEQLNGRLALSVEDGGLGLPVETASEMEFMIAATVGTNFASVSSNRVRVMVTPTAAEKTYPAIWVMGDYSGWNYDNAQLLYSFTGDEVVYEGVVDFGEKAANGFKFSGSYNWGDDNLNWGVDVDATPPAAEAESITLISSGGSGNIMCYSKRFYKFSFSRETNVLTKVFGFDKLGIVGDATPGGWDADTEMDFNPAKRRFWVDADMKAGSFKFRADADWAVNWGSDNSDGVLTPGGGDIKVAEAGKVRVYAYLSNTNELKYELNAKMYGQPENGDEPGPGPEPEPEYDWFIHGQTVATPDWGRTPMEKDAASGAYKALNVEVAASSQFLFTDGDAQWIGADASLQNATVGEDGVFACAVGEAFATSADKVNVLIEAAGLYDIWFFPAESKAYVMLPGETPGEVPVVEPDRWGLVGTINGWGEAPDLYMDEVSEGMFVRKGVTLTLDDQFKIRFNNEWNDAKNYGLEGGNGAIDPNTAVKIITAGNSGNIGITAAGTYDIYFSLANEKVYVMDRGKTPADAGDPEPGPGPTPTDEVWGIVGTLTGWADGADLTLAKEGDFYVRKGVAFGVAAEFKLRKDGKWDVNYGVNDAAPVNIDEAVVLALNSSNNITLAAPGTYDVYFDLAAKKLYVMNEGKTPADAVDPQPADKWGIVGTLIGWTDGSDLEMTAYAPMKNTFVRTGVALTTADAFKIRANNQWNDAKNYGLDGGEGIVSVDTKTPVITSGGSGNMKVAADGTYDIYFDLDNSAVYIMTAGKNPEQI